MKQGVHKDSFTGGGKYTSQQVHSVVYRHVSFKHSRLHLGYKLTHDRNTVINVWTPRAVEDLVWMWICRAGGDVIRHHDHDVLLQDSTVTQDLVCLNQASWQSLGSVCTNLVLHEGTGRQQRGRHT